MIRNNCQFLQDWFFRHLKPFAIGEIDTRDSLVKITDNEEVDKMDSQKMSLHKLKKCKF